MEEKKADNRIIETRKQIINIEDDLSETKNSLYELEDLEMNFTNINRNLNQCLDILNFSIKNNAKINKIQSIGDNANIYYGKTKTNILEEREIINDKINNLKEKLDELNEILKMEEKEIEKEETEKISEETDNKE